MSAGTNGRFAIVAVLLLACGDNRGARQQLPDAAVDAALDAWPYACSSEADCDPGQLCCLTVHAGGEVEDPRCMAPTYHCGDALCDPLASSCKRADIGSDPPTSIAGTCHANVQAGIYDPRRWNLCGI